MSSTVTSVFTFKVESTFDEWAAIFDSKEATRRHREFNIQPLYRGCSDDDPQKSTTEAEALLAKYPDLRGIISPTTVGVAAAAQVVESAGKCDQVQVTGLGTPNQMRPFLKSGCVKAFQLWDPSVEGEIAGWLSVQMVENGMKLSEGMTISVPDQGDVEINANNLIYAAPMLDFVPGNIDNFNF